eukprot:CAMPEP_0113667486 /NCGR_PEP_ID=MMETSP0038_2-20120614/3463_1 /TAXON_ID=2898 /ORGANISM="Cryptomonas paramecium" /LENGTH=60 /DNA_ID=CAMNT_0000583107 /DNA_START=138 /DNA_END=320 /DNA_ORIENTATION=- /assembly_acc=CAM_ASM_000170
MKQSQFAPTSASDSTLANVHGLGGSSLFEIHADFARGYEYDAMPWNDEKLVATEKTKLRG